jgi:1,4-dihydroxy-6-naphthoate synthase
MATLKLGISTCPNDTFIFYALAHGLVPIPDVRFEVRLADVEELNHWAAAGEPHVCKVSAAAAAGLLDRYAVSRTGSALGRGVGPVLVSKGDLASSRLDGQVVAVPGMQTTARLLLDLYCREAGVRPELRAVMFDEVAGMVEDGSAAAGVMIHEGRFTFKHRGLQLMQDLGQWWEARFNLPLPLGVILIRRDLGDLGRRIERAIGESLRLARTRPQDAWGYVQELAQELDDTTIQQHIDTFVTDFSDDLGKEGAKALAELLSMAGYRGSAQELLI